MEIKGYSRAYNELYLNNAMVTLATMLDYAVNFAGEDIDYIFKKFIDSGCAMTFERGDPALITGKSGVELYSLITGKYSFLPPYFSFNRSSVYWLGWALAYYQWYTITSFRDIHKQISLSEMLTWYNTLHEADISRFVDTLNNRLYIKQTNLEYFRKRAGLTQEGLSQLSGVPKRTIQLYEQRQSDISKAQFNILYALSRVLNCTVYDLSEQNKSIYTPPNYNLQYSNDYFINELTNRIAERNNRIAKLQAEQAQNALKQQAYAFGYASQFPYQQLRYSNNLYRMQPQAFTSNWNNYWSNILQQQKRIKDYEETRKQLAKIGLKVIGETAKANNQPLLAMATDTIGIITAENLAEAIQNAVSIINTASKL